MSSSLAGKHFANIGREPKKMRCVSTSTHRNATRQIIVQMADGMLNKMCQSNFDIQTMDIFSDVTSDVHIVLSVVQLKLDCVL